MQVKTGEIVQVLNTSNYQMITSQLPLVITLLNHIMVEGGVVLTSVYHYNGNDIDELKKKGVAVLHMTCIWNGRAGHVTARLFAIASVAMLRSKKKPTSYETMSPNPKATLVVVVLTCRAPAKQRCYLSTHGECITTYCTCSLPGKGRAMNLPCSKIGGWGGRIHKGCIHSPKVNISVDHLLDIVNTSVDYDCITI